MLPLPSVFWSPLDRAASTLIAYAPGSSGTKLALYSPSRVTVHSIGISLFFPDGDVTVATTWLSFTAVKAESATSAEIFTASPGSTRSWVVVTSTGSGTPSTSQRTSRRQNVACVVSSTAILASMRQSHESWIGIASALPRP